MDDLEARIGLPTGRGRSFSLGNALRKNSLPKPSVVDEDEHLEEVVEHLDVIGGLTNRTGDAVNLSIHVLNRCPAVAHRPASCHRR